MPELALNNDLCHADSFCGYLKARMRSLNLKPEELARELEVPARDVSAWLSGSLLPAHRCLWRLAEVLDAEPADLLWAFSVEPEAAAPSLPPLPTLPKLPSLAEAKPLNGSGNGLREAAIRSLLAETDESGSEDSEDEDDSEEETEEND